MNDDRILLPINHEDKMLFVQNCKLILSSAILFMSIAAFAQQTPVTSQKLLYFSKPDTLPYRLISPPKLNPSEKYPLIIFLHGAGERGNDNESQIKHINILATHNNINKFPCFVVAPQCAKNMVWSTLMNGKPFSQTPTRPMEIFLQLYDELLKNYPIDPTRIYVTGLSMGGFGTWDLMARFPNRFAAAVPICGGGDVSTADKIQHIPTWVFHGALDPTVPPQLSRKMVAALQAAGGNPGYTEYPDLKHNSWYQAYKDHYLMTWMFSKTIATDKPASNNRQ